MYREDLEGDGGEIIIRIQCMENLVSIEMNSHNMKK